MAEGVDAVRVQWKGASPEHVSAVNGELDLIARDEIDFQQHKSGAYAKFQEDLLNIPASDVHDLASGMARKDNGHSLVEVFNDQLRITNAGLGQPSRDMLNDFKVASKAVESTFSAYQQADDQSASLKRENGAFSHATQLADAFFRSYAPDTLARMLVDQRALDKVMTPQEQTAMSTDVAKITQMESALKDSNPHLFADYARMIDPRTPTKQSDLLRREVFASQPNLVTLRESFDRRFYKAYDQIKVLAADQQDFSLMSDLRFTAHANYAQALLEGNGSPEAAAAQTKLAFQDLPPQNFDAYAGNVQNWALLAAQGIKQEQIPKPDY